MGGLRHRKSCEPSHRLMPRATRPCAPYHTRATGSDTVTWSRPGSTALRKILAIVVVLLIALYPGAVWLTGRLMEQRTQQTLAQIDKQTPYVRVVDQHYRRGWYRSEQDMTLELVPGSLVPTPAATALSSTLRLQIHSVIHHGPICGLTCFGVARVDSVWVPSPDIAPIIAKYYGSTAPLSITTHIGYFGGRSGTVSTPPLQDVALPDDSHLSWGGITADVKMSASMDRVSVRASMPRFAVRGGADGKQLEVSRVTLDARNERALGSLYSRNLDLRIERIAYHAPNAPDWSAAKIHWAAQMPVASGYMDIAEQIGTGPLQAAAIELREAHFDFALRHLQVQALAALQDQAGSLYQQRAMSLRPDVGAMLGGLREPIQQLLLANPELRFDRVGITTANGQILLHGSVRLPGVTAADFGGDSDPKLLLQKLDVSIDVTADDRALADLPGLAAQTQQQLASLAQRGLVTHESGHWHTTMQLAHGQATINGKAMGAAPGLSSGAPAQSP
jgi:uncharacterized protein YdgA (DUF945 family)